MKNILQFALFLYLGIFMGAVFADEIKIETKNNIKTENCIVVEVNSEMVLLSDWRFDEKFLSELPVEIFVSDEDPLLSLIDENILYQQGLDSFKKEVAQRVKEVENFLENGNLIRTINGVVRKIRDSELSKEEKTKFEGIFKAWQNDLICDFFFPGEKYIWREKDTRKIVFSLAEKLNVTPAFLKEKLLRKVFAKRMFEDFEKQEKICVFPKEIKNYYNQFSLEFVKIQHTLMGTKEITLWITDQLGRGKTFGELGILNIQMVSDISFLTPQIKSCVGGILSKNNCGFGFVESDRGYHIIAAEKISFQEAQEDIYAKILKRKEEEKRKLFIQEFRKKAIVGVYPDFYSEDLEKAGYERTYRLGGK